jgi:ribosome recycling factor
MASNLGRSVAVEGDGVRVTIPDLSQERRLEYVKVMKERSELARIGIRNARQKTMKDNETQQESGLSEDEAKRRKEEVEKEVKVANDRIAELREAKEKELMTV